MIVVTVGTNETPFDRLLEALTDPGGEEMLVQHGPSHVRPPGALCVDYLDFDQLVAEIGRSRAVVTHAGVGSIMVALSAGLRPIVMTRRSDRGEAVDDHQVPLARVMDERGLISLVEGAEGPLRPDYLGRPRSDQRNPPDLQSGRAGRASRRARARRRASA